MKYGVRSGEMTTQGFPLTAAGFPSIVPGMRICSCGLFSLCKSHDLQE